MCLVEEKRLIRDQANRTNYLSYHRRCGHANLKNLVTFKRHGKVTASRLPPKFLRNYRKDCPISVAMKMRRKSLPKGSNSAHELDHLVPWEEVFTDSSGKFRRKSKQGNNYFTVFVCATTGDKITIVEGWLRRNGRKDWRAFLRRFSGPFGQPKLELYLCQRLERRP